MKLKKLLTLAILAGMGQAQTLPDAPKPGKQFWAITAAHAGSWAADLTTTAQKVGVGACYESDKLYGREPSNARLAAEGGAFFAAETVGAYFAAKSKHKWVRRIGQAGVAVSTAAHTYAAVHNSQLRCK